jgi:hypothetical protein
MDTLIEVVFRSLFSDVDFSFLEPIIVNSTSVRFNSPEIEFEGTYEDMKQILVSNDYTDVVILTDSFGVDQVLVKNVFINIGVNDKALEVLLYFDSKGIGFATHKENVDYLMSWANEFKNRYHFKYVIGQFDNGGEDECYFINNEFGPLYDSLKNI